MLMSWKSQTKEKGFLEMASVILLSWTEPKFCWMLMPTPEKAFAFLPPPSTCTLLARLTRFDCVYLSRAAHFYIVCNAEQQKRLPFLVLCGKRKLAFVLYPGHNGPKSSKLGRVIWFIDYSIQFEIDSSVIMSLFPNFNYRLTLIFIFDILLRGLFIQAGFWQ